MNKTIAARVAVQVGAACVLAAGLASGQTLAIPVAAGAKVYLAPMGGFEVYLAAAFEKKRVPVEIVADRAQANFVIAGVSESQKAGWAKMVFERSAQSAEEASITVTDASTGKVVYAYAVNKGNSWRGKQSSAEACAKHFKSKLETGE